MRGETLWVISHAIPTLISIHSPHTRGDQLLELPQSLVTHFNPLPSHEGRRRDPSGAPAWDYFNPLPSHEGRREGLRGNFAQSRISIHSPHTRGDAGRKGRGNRLLDFNPLPSHEGRRQISVGFNDCFFISIHSPHTRGDPLIDKIAALEAISIRSPHARGDRSRISRSLEQTISIHSPHTRGDVQDALSSAGNGGISIRSPHTRGDDLAVRDLQRGFDFNPLPSHEGRQVSSGQACTCSISIHSPHTRGDKYHQGKLVHARFQSTPLIRGETQLSAKLGILVTHFNPLLSCEGRRGGKWKSGHP